MSKFTSLTTKIFTVVLFLALAGCAENKPENIERVTQISTIDALLAGVYDGAMPLGDLKKYGNCGIGTFDALDGEMLMLDGEIYQIRASGKISKADLAGSTPFASLCRFTPGWSGSMPEDTDYAQTQKFLDDKFPNQNLFYAFRIEGSFSYVKTRSVPAQKKPYPPLAEVTKKQPVFERENVKGTIFGFRCPAYVKGVNVPGYHVHFLSDDRQFGGHVLNFVTGEAKTEAQILRDFRLILPKGQEGFSTVDLSRDRSHELEKVEK